MSNGMVCPACGKPCNGHYEVPDAAHPGKTLFVGFCCVPAKVRAKYPGWEGREAAKAQHAARARANFHPCPVSRTPCPEPEANHATGL